jgi:hypothetical protein
MFSNLSSKQYVGLYLQIPRQFVLDSSSDLAEANACVTLFQLVGLTKCYRRLDVRAVPLMSIYCIFVTMSTIVSSALSASVAIDYFHHIHCSLQFTGDSADACVTCELLPSELGIT